MTHSTPRQPGAWKPTIECLETRQVPSALSTAGHGHDGDPAAVEAAVHQEPARVEVDALAHTGDSSSDRQGRGHEEPVALKKGGELLQGGGSSLGLMDLPEKDSDHAPKSPKQEVDMADNATSGAGNSGKHANGNSDAWKDDSPTSGIDERIQKALGDAQSLEDTIPLDVTRVIKSAKGQADRALDKAGKAEGAADTSSDPANDASSHGVSAKFGNSSDEPASAEQPQPPAGDAVVSVPSLQVEPGRAARAESRAASTDATPAAGAGTGASDPSGQAPADTTVPVTPATDAAADPAKAALPHASSFAIDLLMSTTASRASLAILATGLAGMDHAQSVPIAVVPAPAEAPVSGVEIESPARDNDPVAGMGEEIAPDAVPEMHPGTPVQSLAATALGAGLDEVVGRVERALDNAVNASSLRRLLPWLAGAGLVVAAVDVVRRQKSHQEQSRETVGADHDADTWLPRSITEKA